MNVRQLYAFLACMLVFRLLLAALFPMTNDEVYYWDWGRGLQLSYFDHPPGVALMTFVAQHVAPGQLSARLLAPFFHLLATLVLLHCLPLARARGEAARASETWVFAFLTQLVPGFSLWGFLALPDTGLLLFLSVSLLLSLRFVERAGALRWSDGFWLGSAMGLAGLCKYHALPVAGGMALGLMLSRWPRREFGFWSVLVVIGALWTTPVWIWNAEHDFASFAFQSEHGFGGARFDPVLALRAFGGQLLFITPVVTLGMLAMIFHMLRRRKMDRRWLVPVLGFLPLFFLIELVSPFKQSLPHWVLPGFWILIPFYAARVRPRGRVFAANAGFAAAVSLALPWALALTPVREDVVRHAAGDPSYLSELTLWPELARVVSRELSHQAAPSDPELRERCGPRPVLASLRWFWTAQLAFQMQDQPVVRSFDVTGKSYYDFRDAAPGLAGCPIVVIADRRHVQVDQISRYVTVLGVKPLFVPHHERLPVVWIDGILKDPRCCRLPAAENLIPSRRKSS